MILDRISTVPTCAYSTRKLLDAYSGSAIRVRELVSSGEADIGFDSKGDLDYAALGAHLVGANGVIVNWYDQSGNGNDLGQTTAANQPALIIEDTNFGYRSTVDFDGASDFMLAADSASYKTSDIQLNIVFKAVNGNDTLIGYPHDVTHSAPFFRWSVFLVGTAGRFNLRIDTDSPDVTGLVGADVKAQVYNYFTNGRDFYQTDPDTDETASSGKSITYPNAVGLNVGANVDGNENVSGQISEIILFSSAHTYTDRNLLMRDHMDYFNLVHGQIEDEVPQFAFPVPAPPAGDSIPYYLGGNAMNKFQRGIGWP